MHIKGQVSPVSHFFFTVSLYGQFLPSCSFLIPANDGIAHVFYVLELSTVCHMRKYRETRKMHFLQNCVDRDLAVPGGYQTDGLPVIVSSTTDERTSS